MIDLFIILNILVVDLGGVILLGPDILGMGFTSSSLGKFTGKTFSDEPLLGREGSKTGQRTNGSEEWPSRGERRKPFHPHLLHLCTGATPRDRA